MNCYKTMYAREQGIEDVIGDGTVIDAKSEQPITPSVKEEQNAGLLKRLYERYKDSYIGQKYHEYLGRSPDIDGYGVVDMPENALAAIIKTDHPVYKNILALNRRYLNQMKEKGGEYWDKFKQVLNDYIFPHEDTHAAGEHSEENTEGKLKKFYNRLKEYASNAADRVKYGRLEELAEARAYAQAGR